MSTYTKQLYYHRRYKIKIEFETLLFLDLLLSIYIIDGQIYKLHGCYQLCKARITLLTIC